MGEKTLNGWIECLHDVAHIRGYNPEFRKQIKVNRTVSLADISDCIYRERFILINEYLSTYWFPITRPIWKELAVSIAGITEQIVNKHLFEVLSEDALKSLEIDKPSQKDLENDTVCARCNGPATRMDWIGQNYKLCDKSYDKYKSHLKED